MVSLSKSSARKTDRPLNSDADDGLLILLLTARPDGDSARSIRYLGKWEWRNRCIQISMGVMM